MSLRRGQLEAVAALFTYPESGYMKRVDHAVACSGPAALSLQQLAQQLRCMPLNDLQELYTCTFDLGPFCALELGWHLFGEDYKRGLLLVRMRRELQANGIAESHELPDHLSHALLLLARMAPSEAEGFAGAIVLPALTRMLQRMPAENPLVHLLAAARQLVNLHFPAAIGPVTRVAEGAVL
ncbi:MAG TPA: molecular chaperone TorD family protein [Candidatus Binatia bacterium]|nr:molecular chaperone TorD family protein [Candidatus Binatia bacterium]